MSRKAKNFILLVEIVERELPASVLVGAELAARGHNVWLIEKGRFRKSPASFPPSIVLEKGLSKGCLERFRSIRGAGHVLAVMCQEGFIYPSGQDYIARRVHAETVKEVGYMFLWGERQKRDLEPFLDTVRGFHVTGNPRLDLLQARFRPALAPDADAIREQHGDFVLFTSRFSSVNHFRRSLDETLDRRKGQYGEGARETVDERMDIRRRLFEDYQEMIGQIAARFPQTSFVVRPHPVENADVWRERFKAVPNVAIRDEGAASPWLAAATCVVHNACTTGIEAYLLDKPVIEYHPASIARGDFDPVLPGEVTGSCDTVDALAGWLAENMKAAGPPARRPETETLIAHYLANAGEPNAYLRMADAMEEFGAPGVLAKLRNMLSTKHDSRKMQQRHFALADIDRLLQAYVACDLRDKLPPAVLDEMGIRLVR
jgi:surface carbohydrate biosynthesis protein